MIRACSRSRFRNPPVGGGSAFTPLSLFTAGEQGAWYDPSDLSTLFQDVAATIPVTTSGQTVALMRDKSGRNNHASQAVAASRPTFRTGSGLAWLEFDGSDDFLVTAAIDMTITSKLSTFTGLFKANDAGTAIVFEFSADANANTGSFYLEAPPAPASPSYTFAAKATNIIGRNGAPFAAPITNVVSGIVDLRVTQVIRVNAIQTSGATPNHGAGSFGNYPLYLGRRGGTTFPFAGNLYGLVIVGALSDSLAILNSEGFMAMKSGIAF